MSVQETTFVVWGICLPYDAELTTEQNDALEKYRVGHHDDINPCDGISVILDGMDGKYIVIGKIHYKSESFTCALPSDPMFLTNLENIARNDCVDAIIKCANIIFPDRNFDMEEELFNLMVFTHYS